MTQHMEQELRHLLDRYPRRTGSTVEAIAAISRAKVSAGRRRRRNSSAMLAVAVAGIVAATVSAIQYLPRHTAVSDAAPRPAPTMLGWPPRGELSGDTALIADAAQAIPAALGVRLDPAASYAGTISGYGRLVVLTGKRRDQSVAVFVTSATPGAATNQFAARTVVRAIVPFPLDEPRTAIGFTAPLIAGDRSRREASTPILAVALISPRTTRATITNSLLDAPLTDTPGLPPVPNDGVVATLLLDGSGAWNTTVATEPIGAPIGVTIGGGLTEQSTIKGEVISDGSTVRLTTTSGPLLVGDLVATSKGLLGTITSVQGTTGTVGHDLSGLAHVQSFTTNYPGRLTSTARTTYFTPQGATTNGVNRIVVSVPRSHPTIAISVGVVKSAGKSTALSAAQLPITWEVERSESGSDLASGTSVPVTVIHPVMG